MPRFVPFLIDLAWNTVNSFNLQSFSICNLFLAQGIFLLLLSPPSKILVICIFGFLDLSSKSFDFHEFPFQLLVFLFSFEIVILLELSFKKRGQQRCAQTAIFPESFQMGLLKG